METVSYTHLDVYKRQEQESAPHPKQVLYVELDKEADVYDILRREEETKES